MPGGLGHDGFIFIPGNYRRTKAGLGEINDLAAILARILARMIWLTTSNALTGLLSALYAHGNEEHAVRGPKIGKEIMNKISYRTSLSAIALAATTPLILATAAPAGAASTAKPLPCHASMSNSRPADFTTTDVRVKTAAHAGVTTVAHYRTVNRKHHRTANSAGKATVPYYISGATPGFRVVVKVYVSRGSRKGTCSTSFLPHR